MIAVAGGILLAVFILIFLPLILRALGIVLLYLIGIAILIIIYKYTRGYEEELFWIFISFIIIVLIINIIKDWRAVLKGFIELLKYLLIYICLAGSITYWYASNLPNI